MRKRVLEIVATLERAGAERLVTELARRLDRGRFETAVVSLYDPRPKGLEPELEACGVRVWHLGKHSGPDVRMYPRLLRAAREFRPDIVHTHSYVMRYALPLARRARIVHTVHNMALFEVDALGRAVHRAGWRTGAVPVAVSRHVARSFREVYGFEPRVIANGIDTAAYMRPGARERWRAEHGFSCSDRIVACVARLHPQKNPLGLCEAFARVPDAHLVLAGGGPLESEIRRRAGDRVHLAGIVEDVAGLLSAADAFAIASDWEGNPLSVMEAMAAGLPVAATAVGGVPELVEDGVTGVLVQPGDMRALGDAIAFVLAHPGMGEAARSRAARFEIGRMVASYEELFETL